MTLLSLIIAIALIGVALWLVQIAPIDATIKRIIWWVAIVCVIVYILYAIGVMDHIRQITVPHI